MNPIALYEPSLRKVHLAKYDDNRFAVALIYPAEFDDEFSRWLLDNDFATKGEAAGGVGGVGAPPCCPPAGGTGGVGCLLSSFGDCAPPALLSFGSIFIGVKLALF